MNKLTHTTLLSVGALCIGGIAWAAQKKQSPIAHSSRLSTHTQQTASQPVKQTTSAPIKTHLHQDILTITLNRPRVLNAIDLEMAEQLH
ncbi:MAG TPA: hypothetical protein ACFE0H_07535 [Elainellaceae cyanobacterium]